MMDEKRIEEIVWKVFDKAKKEHASHSRFALSNHISSQSDLSSKTLERAYDRYIDKKKKHGPPNAESVNLFCNYLNFEDYGAYIRSNPKEKLIKPPILDTDVKRNIFITISIVLVLTLMILGVQKWPLYSPKSNLKDIGCMTWADSLYVSAPCDQQPFSQYGTKVEPLIETKLKNLRKVEVDAAFEFFSKEGKPLIWYYKKSSSEIEYFTAPGLHPTNGETLRKITPYIIQTYVPFHANKRSSFVQ